MDRMRILLVGASGTIGAAIVKALPRSHELLLAGRSRAPLAVDIADPESIRHLLSTIGRLDALVCAAGQARFRPLAALRDADLRFSIDNKLLGQVNLIRHGLSHLREAGSITVTGGQLARRPMPGGAAVSLVNAALEGFVRAAALEAPHRIRINLVSPPRVASPMEAGAPGASAGVSAEAVAQAYLRSLEGSMTGEIITI